MNKETRKEIKETFEALGKMLSQAGSVEVLVKSTPGFDELLAKAKAYSQYLAMKRFECRNYVDIRSDIVKAVEAIENCQSEVDAGRSGNECFNVAKEVMRNVNAILNNWVGCCVTEDRCREWNLPMIDLSTASGEEVIEEAKKVITLLSNNKHLPTEVELDLTEWLFAFGIRLSNDAKGVPLMTEDEIQKKIKEWAELV
ncbi:MAG: hypothetical protein IKL96_01305 [Kiritimatiellae bacterium]|nr:hypothetical protein [Kiritimatiellia bacterium]